MGLLECASGASVWRGYDYCNEKKVKNLVEPLRVCLLPRL